MDLEINQVLRVESLFTQEDGFLFTSKLISFRNNTIDVSLAECSTKEDFAFEELKPPHGLEADSPAGKIA